MGAVKQNLVLREHAVIVRLLKCNARGCRALKANQAPNHKANLIRSHGSGSASESQANLVTTLNLLHAFLSSSCYLIKLLLGFPR